MFEEQKIVQGRPRLAAQTWEAANRLKLCRLERGLTAAQVAERLGIPTTKYLHIEAQFSSSAQDQYLEALGSILAVDPKWIRADPGEAWPSNYPVIDQISVAPKVAKEIRLVLAERAARRRKEMLIGCSELARTLSLKPAFFYLAERCLPAKLAAETQARWEAALRVPSGWLFDSRIATPALPRGPEKQDESQENSVTLGDTVTAEIVAISIWLSRKSLARRTLDFDQLTTTERSWANIFATRYGILGEEASTLESIGQGLGLTRERIRQIVKKMSERSQDLEISTPNLDQLKTDVEALAPAGIEEIDKKLRGLLGDHLSVRSVQRFANEVLGRRLAEMRRSPWLNKAKRPDVVVGNDGNANADFMAVVRSCAIKMIRTTGAAQVQFVAGEVSEEMGTAASCKDVRATCALVKGFSWLIEEDDWFWFGEDFDNRLLTVTKKVLAAAGKRVDVEELYAAMGRSHRGYYAPEESKPYPIEAPVSVVLQALSKVPWLKAVQSNDFLLVKEVAPASVLSEVEFAIYEFIKAKNGVASKFAIDTHIKAILSVTPMAVATAVARSPIFTKPGRGLYAIRGVEINPTGLLEARSSVGGPCRA